MATVRIGLGSNLGDTVATVRMAITALDRLGQVTARSHLYRSPPWGMPSQSDFVNAAAVLETALAPRDLLRALQALEVELGRVASYRWGPRHIDLDILTYDDVSIREAGLTVPHEHLLERAFVLVPLSEIDPAFRTACDALPHAERAGLVRVAQSDAAGKT